MKDNNSVIVNDIAIGCPASLQDTSDGSRIDFALFNFDGKLER